jgi:hypothetical protein
VKRRVEEEGGGRVEKEGGGRSEEEGESGGLEDHRTNVNTMRNQASLRREEDVYGLLEFVCCV